MKYMLLIYANHLEAPQYTPEQQQGAMKAWNTFGQEAQAAGVLLHSEGLMPVTSARTVRVRSGKMMATEGPFAETHEQLGGYYMLDCKDIDEAIEWAAKLPGAWFGSVEVRPVASYEGQ
jgi:hypothetical protein